MINNYVDDTLTKPSGNYNNTQVKAEVVNEKDTVNNKNEFVNSKIKTGGSLQSKNVRIHNRRTSVRLEPEMWNALNEIAAFEGCSIHDLCGAVHDLKNHEASFTAALRVFMMEYYRSAAITNGQVSNVQKKIQIKTLINKNKSSQVLQNDIRS